MSECNTCGANGNTLVCAYCGNAREKPEKQKPSLDRRIVNSDMGTHKNLANVELRGDMNTIIGCTNCVIKGDMNTVKDACLHTVVDGDMNTVTRSVR